MILKLASNSFRDLPIARRALRNPLNRIADCAQMQFHSLTYDDGNLIKFAYSYEQATHHRKPPASTTAL